MDMLSVPTIFLETSAYV